MQAVPVLGGLVVLLFATLGSHNRSRTPQQPVDSARSNGDTRLRCPDDLEVEGAVRAGGPYRMAGR